MAAVVRPRGPKSQLDPWRPEDDGSHDNDIPQHHQIDYRAYLKPELRELLISRFGRVPKGCRHKRDYVATLLKADEEYRFRFLDLPPEMRNMVYGELLHFPKLLAYRGDGAVDTRRKCWPAILAVSKQVQAEAESLLYSENDFGIHISQHYYNGNRNQVTRVWFENSFFHVGSLKDLLQVTSLKTLPNHLLKVQDLSVDIKLSRATDADVLTQGDASQSDPEFHDLNYYLYYFCSFLATSAKLQKVTINVDASKYPGFDAVADKILRPLAKLPTLKSIAIEGVSDFVEDRLRTESRQKKTGNNVVGAAELVDRIDDLRDALSASDAVRTELRTLREPLAKALEYPGYADRVRDNQLMRLVSESSGSVRRIGRNARSTIERRVATLVDLLEELDVG